MITFLLILVPVGAALWASVTLLRGIQHRKTERFAYLRFAAITLVLFGFLGLSQVLASTIGSIVVVVALVTFVTYIRMSRQAGRKQFALSLAKAQDAGFALTPLADLWVGESSYFTKKEKQSVAGALRNGDTLSSSLHAISSRLPAAMQFELKYDLSNAPKSDRFEIANRNYETYYAAVRKTRLSLGYLTIVSLALLAICSRAAIFIVPTMAGLRSEFAKAGSSMSSTPDGPAFAFLLYACIGLVLAVFLIGMSVFLLRILPGRWRPWNHLHRRYYSSVSFRFLSHNGRFSDHAATSLDRLSQSLPDRRLRKQYAKSFALVDGGSTFEASLGQPQLVDMRELLTLRATSTPLELSRQLGRVADQRLEQAVHRWEKLRGYLVTGGTLLLALAVGTLAFFFIQVLNGFTYALL